MTWSEECSSWKWKLNTSLPGTHVDPPLMIRLPRCKAMLTCYVPAGLVLFETLKKCIPALFNVLCSDKIKLCWRPGFSGAISQSSLGSWLLGCSLPTLESYLLFLVYVVYWLFLLTLQKENERVALFATTAFPTSLSTREYSLPLSLAWVFLDFLTSSWHVIFFGFITGAPPPARYFMGGRQSQHKGSRTQRSGRGLLVLGTRRRRRGWAQWQFLWNSDVPAMRIKGAYKKKSLFGVWGFFLSSQLQVLLSSCCHKGRTHSLVPALNGKKWQKL